MGILSSVPAKVKQKSPFEMRMAYFATGSVGGTDADLDHEDSAGLSYSGKIAYAGHLCVLHLILWVSSGIPDYVTSLIRFFSASGSGAWTEKATLGGCLAMK